MGLFDFLKKRNKVDEQFDEQTLIDIDKFEKELLALVPRYVSNPNAKVDIRARHKETNEVIPFAVGFSEQFNLWRTIRTFADRKDVIYSLLDSQFGHQLDLWQFIERFNDDRYAEKALQISKEHKQPSDEKNANYWNALARTNFILTNYREAEMNCEKALALDNQNIRTKRVHADILHSTNRQVKAHEIYNEILKEKIPSDKKMNLSIQELLGFDGDIMNSPIYAIGWLQSDKSVTAEIWEWANDEFYYSPHFRTQYALELIKKGDNLKGFAKLLSLSNEMPWFKEAVINSVRLIEQLNLSDELKEEKLKFEKIIEDKKWTDTDL